MKESLKGLPLGRIASVFVATFVLLAAVLLYNSVKPAVAEADIQTMTGQINGEQQAVIQKAIQEGGYEGTGVAAQALTSPDDCTATIYYYEYVDYDDPDANMVGPGVRLLGVRTLTGLTEGQQLNAWDYVVDITGHFFFDGWPFSLTVSTDPSQNTFEFFYFKLYNYEYTVNYYLMTGADLQADNWKDALAPEGVKFEKLGSETFYDQRYDQLVEGDAYEYQLDGMYVIDTYPAQIRLGADADNNVINVLYTPTSSTLPDFYEVSDDEVLPPDADEGSDGDLGESEAPDGDGSNDSTPGDSASGGSTPGNGTPDGDTPSGDAPGDVSGGSTPDVTLPDDEVFDRDEIIDIIPGGDGDDTIIEDFIGPDAGSVTITDEMLEHPVNKDQAEQMIYAYQTGVHNATLPQTGDIIGSIMWALVGAAGAAAVALVIALVMRKRSAEVQ